MATKCSAIYTAMAVAILLAAAGVAALDSTSTRSYLTSWGGPGCSGQAATAGSCGCSDLQYYGGHEFSFHGETATLYTETGCAGTPYQLFEDTQACGDLGWRSINIDC
ncbi:hypothetical protein ACP70R_010188 [Stipagrostis hirtigluma subsp. patula]